MDKLLALIFSIFFSLSVMAAPAPVGKVSSLSGTLEAKQGKTITALQKDSPVFEGQTLSLKNGDAEITFDDEAVFSLKPGTKFKIEQYSLKTKKSWVKLLKGAFQTVTGLIAKENPKGYKAETPVATIGVRGTSYQANETRIVWKDGGDLLVTSKKDGKQVVLNKDNPTVDFGCNIF